MLTIMIGLVLVVAIGLALCRYVRWRDVGLLAIFGLAFALIFAASDGQKRDGPDNEVIINGSGRLVSKEIPVAEFDEVETDLAIGLDIRQGDEYSVVFTADDTLVDYLQVVQEGTSLTLDLDPRFAYELLGVTMRAEITAPKLTRLHLEGSSGATLNNIQSLDRFEAELTGSAALVGGLVAEQATFKLYGNSYLELSGSGRQLTVDSCGNNRANLGGFAAGNGTIQASCHSYLTVNVDGQLDIDVSQYARVANLGRPDAIQGAAHKSATAGDGGEIG